MTTTRRMWTSAQPVVHWQHPARTDTRAVCHGRKTTAPVTTDRAQVTCGTCRQSSTWKNAAVAS